MAASINIHINHLQHVGIPVTDMQVSVAFYERLGFQKVMESAFELEGSSGICVMMENNRVLVELYRLPEHMLPAIRNRKDGHVDHIAFDVDDIDAVFEVLQTASFSILEPAPVFLPFWSRGCKYFNILGPDGERLEFNQIVR